MHLKFSTSIVRHAGTFYEEKKNPIGTGHIQGGNIGVFAVRILKLS